MTFDEFIAGLGNEDKKNYLKYSQVRGVQAYKIIFNALYEKNPNVSYLDVNSFIKYDKAIKDVLFIYIGTLEDLIRKHIFKKFDLIKDIEYKDYYVKFEDLKNIVEEKDNTNDDVTELYARWSLMMKETILFLKKYDSQKFNINKLEQVRKLRNEVMHHSYLLFDSYGKSKCKITCQRIKSLSTLLPNDYIGLISMINNLTNKTKENVKNEYGCFVLSLL